MVASINEFIRCIGKAAVLALLHSPADAFAQSKLPELPATRIARDCQRFGNGS